MKFAYVGDGNNMCHSLLVAGARCGAHVRVATPAGYEPDAAIVAEAKRVARETRGKIEILRSPRGSCSGRAGCVHGCLGQHGTGRRSR